MWNLGYPLLSWPHLFSFAKNKEAPVAAFLGEVEMLSLFHLPLSPIASIQLNALIEGLSSFEPSAERTDEWSYIWGSSSFSSKQAYAQLLGASFTQPPFIWLWKSFCLSKQKFFFWLLLKDRLNTKDLLTRKQFPLSDRNCTLCSDHILEDSKHLFFGCSFSERCWLEVGFDWNFSLSVGDIIQDGKLRSRLKCFKEVTIVTCWSIWLLRNNIIFNQGVVSLERWKILFKEAFALVIHRVKPSLRVVFVDWLRDFG